VPQGIEFRRGVARPNQLEIEESSVFQVEVHESLAIDVRFLKVSFEPYFRPHKIRLAVFAGFTPRLVCETHMLRRSNAEQSYPAEPGDVKGAGILDAGDDVGTLVEGSQSESRLQR